MPFDSVRPGTTLPRNFARATIKPGVSGLFARAGEEAITPLILSGLVSAYLTTVKPPRLCPKRKGFSFNSSIVESIISMASSTLVCPLLPGLFP